MNCKVCSSETSLFGSAVLLNRHKVRYYRCHRCGFVQTEDPYWLEEVYGSVMTGSDVGLVARNLSASVISRAVITSFFNPQGRFLDYAGGYGLFVRLMRDAGFDFYWLDKFCPNLFAKGFEAGPLDGGEGYELVTAFEVFEHLSHPWDEIKDMSRFSKNILFSTEVIPPDAPKPGTWWYYGPEHGQHISFYTLDTLSIIANGLNLRLLSNGRSLHLLTERKVPPLLFKLLSIRPIAQMFNVLRRRPSLVQQDFLKAVQGGLEGSGEELEAG